jgi:hypothetical protein
VRPLSRKQGWATRVQPRKNPLPEDAGHTPRPFEESADGEKPTPWWVRYPRYFLREVRSVHELGFTARFREWNAVNEAVPSGGARSAQPFARPPKNDPGAVRLVVDGRVRVKAARPGETERWHGFDVEFGYPPDFPFDKIDVRPLDRRIRDARHQLGGSGDLCYMQEQLEPWAFGYGIARALEGATDWFEGYVTGTFKNEVPAAELLSYLERDAAFVRAVLLPSHAVWQQPPGVESESSSVPHSYGIFTLEIEGGRGTSGFAIFGAAGLLGEHVDDIEVRAANQALWHAIRSDPYAQRLRARRSRRRDAGIPFRNRDKTFPNEAIVDPDAPKTIQGLWFALDDEPRPFKDLAGLERTLREHLQLSRHEFRRLLEKTVLHKDARARGWIPVAITYAPAKRRPEGPQPQREWLMLLLAWPPLPAKRNTGRRLKDNNPFWPTVNVRGVPSFWVRSVDLQRRIGTAYAVATVSSRASPSLSAVRIAVIGIGALGSTIARSLAAMGVCNFVVVDPDIVTPGNVVRHEARLPEVGLPKVDAMEKILRETNPYVDVKRLNGTRHQGGKLETALLDPNARPDLIIVTTAVKAVDGQIDGIARSSDPPIPVLHAWVMAEAQVLRAFLYRPGQTACMYCNGLYARAQEKSLNGDRLLDHARSGGGINDGTFVGYIGEPKASVEPFYEASCADPTFPGAGNANALAAHVIVEMALDALQGRLSDEESHWVYAGNRVKDLDPNFPVAPLTITRHGYPPHPECPVCGPAGLETGLSDFEREDYERELAAALDEQHAQTQVR